MADMTCGSDGASLNTNVSRSSNSTVASAGLVHPSVASPSVSPHAAESATSAAASAASSVPDMKEADPAADSSGADSADDDVMNADDANDATADFVSADDNAGMNNKHKHKRAHRFNYSILP